MDNSNNDYKNKVWKTPKQQSSEKNKNKKKGRHDYDDEIVEEIEIFKTEIMLDRKYYLGMNYLSNKEKSEFESKFSKPKNSAQEKYMSFLRNNKSRIIVSTGPSGTGKTLLAVEQGIRNFLVGNVDKIIFTRPVVSVDEDLGFLPGGIDEKMAPWIRPIHDILYQFIHPKEVERMVEHKEIEISPLAYMRGRTFKNCWIVADEMQNSTVSQMKMLLTRVGENTKLVITGDLDQHDRHAETNGLEDFTNKLRRTRSVSIHSVEFDKADVERDQVVKEVLDIYGMENQVYAFPEDVSGTSPLQNLNGLMNNMKMESGSDTSSEKSGENK
jgi:phosphate starvation-inducible PhoH-like protein